MKLPAEIRIMIYELAIQDSIAAAVSDAASERDANAQPYLGALALVYTTSNIRQESYKAMSPIAEREQKVLLNRCNFFLEASLATRVPCDLTREYHDRSIEAGIQMFWIANVWTAVNLDFWRETLDAMILARASERSA
jgi:hypothetical protein